MFYAAEFQKNNDSILEPLHPENHNFQAYDYQIFHQLLCS